MAEIWELTSRSPRAMRASGWARSAATSWATMPSTSSLPTLPMVVMAAPGAVAPRSAGGGRSAVRQVDGAWRDPRRNGNLGCGGYCLKKPQGAPGAAPCGQGASAQELEHVLGGLVGLGQHRGTGLLQDLVARELRRFLGEVRVLDPAARGRQVLDRGRQVGHHRGEAVLHRAHIGARG